MPLWWPTTWGIFPCSPHPQSQKRLIQKSYGQASSQPPTLPSPQLISRDPWGAAFPTTMWPPVSGGADHSSNHTIHTPLPPQRSPTPNFPPDVSAPRGYFREGFSAGTHLAGFFFPLKSPYSAALSPHNQCCIGK